MYCVINITLYKDLIKILLKKYYILNYNSNNKLI